MVISKNILSNTGFIKTPFPFKSELGEKIRLYHFPSPTLEIIVKLQEVVKQQTKYVGDLNVDDKEIEETLYLLKKGASLQWISTEEALQLQKNSSYGIEGQHKLSQGTIDPVRNGPTQSHLWQMVSLTPNENIADDPIKYYEKALQLSLELKDQVEEIRAYGNLGNTYDSRGDHLKAVKYHKKALKVSLEIKSRLEESVAYGNLGNAYNFLKKHPKAVKCHEAALKIAKELGDVAGERRAYGNLGNAYASLGKLQEAAENYEKALEIPLQLNGPPGARRIYSSLGNVYHSLGQHSKALEYHQKALNIFLALNDQVEMRASYNKLGISYHYLGEYSKAMKCYQSALQISLELKDLLGESAAYGELGISYRSLGEYRKAVNYHHKALEISQMLNNKVGMGKDYCNLGSAYQSLKDSKKAAEYHEKALKIYLELNDKVNMSKAYSNLGVAYDYLEQYGNAITYYEKSLDISVELSDKVGESRAYCNLGNAYNSLDNYPKAIECYLKDLKISIEELKDKISEGIGCYNLGNIYGSIGEFKKAEGLLRNSIEIAAQLQQDLTKSQWQVTIFEEQAKRYLSLENVLLFQGKHEEALEVSQARRARSLASLISTKLSVNENQSSLPIYLTVQEMQSVAKKLQTVFIIYSLALLEVAKQQLQAWVVSSTAVSSTTIELSSMQDELQNSKKIFEAFPYKIQTKRPMKNAKQPGEVFDESLSRWYDTFIHPLEPHLSSLEKEETLTFIPDGFLAHLPFGAFYDQKKDQYLIEKYPISIAPSIQILSLLHQLPKHSSSKALLVGHPTTPDENLNKLLHSSLEVHKTIAPLMHAFEKEVLTQEKATVTAILQEAPHVKWIHIACHGIAGQKPVKKSESYSVFEGRFHLASDDEHPSGHLHAKDIAFMKLKADLVFMSACHLGRGNLKQEGSIGPIWSFLGAGASSTIASYWPLPDGEVTVKMVDTFYRHYLGIDMPQQSKAKALQQAVLMAMKMDRNKPRQWGAFFLSGLPG
ncbi:MAG: tetratricopeptide repeat protein [Candidatus Rhabdochlamydia sp.]